MSELDMDVGLNIYKVVELVCLLLERDIISLKSIVDSHPVIRRAALGVGRTTSLVPWREG